MTILAIFLFWISLLGVFYAYFGYPILLSVLGNKPEKKALNSPKPHKFSIIVTARNEAAGIEAKIKNCLALIDYYKSEISGEAELVIASDCSEDETDSIVSNYTDQGVKLVRSDERKGKEFAQKNSLSSTSGEIIFFTDVRARLEKDALVLANNYFYDENVGAISTNDKVEKGEKSSGEGFYVKYEMLLRRLESNFCSLIGLSGSGFAVRKSICQEMSTDIPSDFSLILSARAQGLKGVQADDIICKYKAVETEEQEFTRKVRTVLRGMATFFKTLDKRIFDDTVFAWQLLSHKLCRWLVPWQLILIAICLLSLFSVAPVYFVFTLGMFLFIACAIFGFVSERNRERLMFKVPLFFLVTNAAIFVAWLRYLRGERFVSWTPTKN